MATYKEVNGTAVQNYAGTYPGAVDGELWYNSTATTFQFQYGATAGVWATGNNLNNGRKDLAGAGTQTAALAVGGQPPNRAQTETWNGSSWTEVNDLNTATSRFAGAGSQTSAIVFGGFTPPVVNKTESWDGSSWTEVNNLAAARRNLMGTGTSTSGLGIGGTPDGNAQPGVTEEWTVPETVTNQVMTD